MVCGLLGEKLGHSYSPQIHAMLSDYEYRLFEVAPRELDAFLSSDSFDALNVTIPYKKDVAARCAGLSEAAKALGSVNTVVRRPDGSLYGDNTDYYGFERMLAASGVSAAGKKAAVLGSGGASVTVCAVLRAAGADVRVVSRSGECRYGSPELYRDAQLIVNATPVGMYPGNGASPVDLGVFSAPEAVFDLIYNPARTALMLQAEKLGVPAFGGLLMLAAQAKRSSEIFTGRAFDDSVIDDVVRAMSARMRNIVLIGMAGCGKSTVARILARKTGRRMLDSDAEIRKRIGTSIPEFFETHTEDEFRRIETEVLADLGRQSGAVIATGGGCVTREENRDLLRQNGLIVWLRRDPSKLTSAGRPLSQREGAQELYKKRVPMYRHFADVSVSNDRSPMAAVYRIREMTE